MSDGGYMFIWWFYLFIVGIISIPITTLLFRKYFDKGYGFTKSIGILLLSFIVFVLGSLKVSPFSESTVLSIILIYTFINTILVFMFKNQFVKTISKSARTLIIQELLFLLGFMFWSTIRAYQPDINGLEKFMDFGFVNSILKSNYFPPDDMWFAGESINYYWYGHYITAFLTKLTRIPSAITYNLMLATIMGLSLTGVFSIITNLLRASSKNIRLKQIFAAGLLSSLLVVFAGNYHLTFHTIRMYYHRYNCGYNLFDSESTNFTSSSNENCNHTLATKTYWYPDATRFIGYDPETDDKTIHEFPLYSFVVSDLHAHLLNLPFVFLYIALLFKLVADKLTIRKSVENGMSLGFLLGIFFMTNTWDVANYGLLSAITVTISAIYKFSKTQNSKRIQFVKTTFINYLLVILSIGIVSILVVGLFLAHFESIAQGIALVNARTPLWQLLILWGFPLLLTIAFLFIIKKKWKTISAPDLFVMSICITGWLLIFIPEIIYVKDIYIASHHRANTMFKLTYQSFVLFYLTSGYIIIRSLTIIKSFPKKLLGVFVWFIILVPLFYYPKYAIDSYYNQLEEYRGLTGDLWLHNRYPDSYQAYKWLDKIPHQYVILEAPGDSYTEYNVLSSYSGLPTVNGWFVHEWLWRGDVSFPEQRVNIINQIYTSSDLALTKSLLEKFQVRYVVFSSFEREKYPNLYEEKFLQLGQLVYSNKSVRIYEISYPILH